MDWRALLRLLLICLLPLLAADRAAAERVALIIGNAAYNHVSPLANPINDAEDMATTLTRLGFSVSRIDNAGYEAMRRALIEFGRRVRGAEMAIVFFAGHGMEMNGENWLIPVDAELRSDIDVENEAIGLRSLMPMVGVASKLGLVILDACRNNPFAARMQRTAGTRTVARGLARVEPTGSVLVAYAARDGTTAADGAGRNSPFTTALLHHIETPELDVQFVFRRVRDDVLRATGREQDPHIYGSLSGEPIYFSSARAGAGAPSHPPPPASSHPPPPAHPPPVAAPPPPPAHPPPQVAALPQGEFIFPHSGTHYLTRAEVSRLTRAQMRVARNEIYARRGRFFQDRALTAYFSQFAWYRPHTWNVRLNPYEEANVRLIQSMER